MIMEATNDLDELCKIGRFNDKATMHGEVLAIKRTNEDVKEELSILHKRIHIALDVANGLHYMHDHTQPSIVHWDVRARNILVDSNFKAKLAHFSTARPVTNSSMPKVDVFAFGVFLLELLSGKRAMETKENGEVVMLYKDLREVLKVEEKSVERLQKWIRSKIWRTVILLMVP
ncbi:hypothetical protein ACE6H2_024552 [Prunus campanulata]